METGDYMTVNNLVILIGFLAVAVFLLMRVRRSQAKRGEAPGEVVKSPERSPRN